MTNDDLRVVLMGLIDALLRKGSERDGNWGYPSFREELEMLLKALKRHTGDEEKE